jgi:hypothetical protein
MVEIVHILPVSAGSGPVASIANDMIDAEHEEQGQSGHIVVCHSSQLTTVSR